MSPGSAATAIAITTVLALACAPLSVIGMRHWQEVIPNGAHVFRGGLPWPAVGHTERMGPAVASSGDSARYEINAFGKDFHRHGLSWSAVCRLDSDGDGFTNGEELGDAGCTWQPGQQPSRQEAVSHPGFADSTPQQHHQGPAASTGPSDGAPEASSASAEADSARPVVVAESGPVPVLQGRLGFRWRLTAPTATTTPTTAGHSSVTGMTGREILHIDLSSTRPDEYVSVGVSPELMDGPIITCYVEAATGRPICADWVGHGFEMDRRPLPLHSVTSSRLRPDGTFDVSVRIRASDFDVMPQSGKQRVIFAVGRFHLPSETPLVPGASLQDRGQIVVDAYAGQHWAYDARPNARFALVTIVFASFAIVAAAGLMRAQGAVLTPIQSQRASTGLGLVFAAFVIGYGIANYTDNHANYIDLPAERAFGDVAALCFWFVLYPVPKVLNAGRLAGLGYERLVSYHKLVGVSLLLCITLHGGSMIRRMRHPRIELLQWVGPHPVLAGVLAWWLTVIIVVTSLTLRRSLYWLFRSVHLLFLPLIALAVLHYPKLVFAMLPPLVTWFADVCIRIGTTCSAGAIVVRSSYDYLSECGVLTVRVDGSAATPPAAGQFVYVGCPIAGPRLSTHPFSVAWFDEASQEITIVVKNMGPDTWTSKLCAAMSAADCDADRDDVGEGVELRGVCAPDRNTTTLSPPTTSDTCATNEAFPAKARGLVFQGPYGSLTIPLGRTPDIVLVAGGIGITPVLRMLQIIASGGAPAVRRVQLLWTSRDVTLPRQLSHFFADVLRQHKANAGPAVAEGVSLSLYITRQGDAAALSNDDCLVPFATRHCRRLNLPRDVDVPAAATANASVPPLTVYCCGPRPLVAAAQDFARHRANTLLHEESFYL